MSRSGRSYTNVALLVRTPPAGSTDILGDVAGATSPSVGALTGDVIDSGVVAGATSPTSGALAADVTLFRPTTLVISLRPPPARPNFMTVIRTPQPGVSDDGVLAGTTSPTSGALTGDVIDAAALAGATSPSSGALTGEVTRPTVPPALVVTAQRSGRFDLSTGALIFAGPVEVAIPDATLAGTTSPASGALTGEVTRPFPAPVRIASRPTPQRAYVTTTLVRTPATPSVDTGALAGATSPTSGALLGDVIDTGALAGGTSPAVGALTGTIIVSPPTLTDAQLKASIDANALVSDAFTPADGEVLVVKAGTWDSATAPGAPSGGSLTWTQRVAETGGGFNGRFEIWTAVVGTSPGSMTVTLSAPASPCHHAMVLERWSGAKLATTPATGQLSTGVGAAMSTTLTSAADSSVVAWGAYDNSSTDPTSRAYLSSAVEEFLRDPGGANGIFYFAYQQASTAGTQTFGLSTPTGRWSAAGIEIQADADFVDSAALVGATSPLTGALAGDVVDSAALAGATSPASAAMDAEVVRPGPSPVRVASQPTPRRAYTTTTLVRGPSTPSITTGALAGTTSPSVGALTGDVIDSGALAGATSPASGSLTTSSTVTGVLAGATHPPVGALTATSYYAGALAGATSPAVGALVGTEYIPGAAAGRAPVLAGALAGNVTDTGALAGTALLPTAAFNRAPVIHYPLHAGAPVDHVTRYRAGTVVDNAAHYQPGEPT